MSYPIPTSHSYNSDDEVALAAAFRCEDASPRCVINDDTNEMQNLQLLVSHNDQEQITHNQSAAFTFTEIAFSPVKVRSSPIMH